MCDCLVWTCADKTSGLVTTATQYLDVVFYVYNERSFLHFVSSVSIQAYPLFSSLFIVLFFFFLLGELIQPISHIGHFNSPLNTAHIQCDGIN